jgi:hypothetical protein
MTAAQARRVGELVGASGLDDVVDVTVVEVAVGAAAVARSSPPTRRTSVR